jgi:hypothetical protein
MRLKTFFLLLLVLIVGFWAIVFMLTACVPAIPTNISTEIGAEDGLSYTVLDIEGMTCIYFETGVNGSSARAGLTCNWDEWVKKDK